MTQEGGINIRSKAWDLKLYNDALREFGGQEKLDAVLGAFEKAPSPDLFVLYPKDVLNAAQELVKRRQRIDEFYKEHPELDGGIK